MPSVTYILRRIIYSIPILLGVTFLVFVLFNLSGIDPAMVALGKHATPAQIADIHRQLGLDQPLYYQYWQVLLSTFTFNFGHSWRSGAAVSRMLYYSIKVTLTFTLPALCIGQVIAITIALVAIHYRYRWPDRLLVTVSVFMRSISILAYIFFLQWLFATKLRWFPVMGYQKGFPHFVPYVTLPIIIWVVLILGPDLHFYRGVLIDQVKQSYVRTARAKGLSNFSILTGHVLPNAMVPILTNILMSIPSMITGAVVLENFFGIPGAGRLIMDAIQSNDFPVIKAMTIVSALLSIAANILTDVLYTVVDPRIQVDS